MFRTSCVVSVRSHVVAISDVTLTPTDHSLLRLRKGFSALCEGII